MNRLLSLLRFSVALALLVGGCSGTSQGIPQPPPPPPAAGSPSPTVSSSPSSSSLLLTDADNGRQVQVRVGTRITVVLDSTYWTFHGSSNPAVLNGGSAPVISPSPGCIPGEGCGSVTAAFTAMAAGQADVTASRTSCGEARACTGAEGSYRATILVS